MTSESYTVCSGSSTDQYRRKYVVAKTQIKKGDVVIRELPIVAHSRYGFSNRPIWISDEVCIAKTANRQDACAFKIILESLIEKKSPLVISFDWLLDFSDGSENSDWNSYRLDIAYGAVEAVLLSKAGCDFGFTRETHESHLKRFARVWCVNHFACLTDFSHIEFGHALYKTSSFFNHSCAPNCHWVISDRQSMVIFANTDIEVGSEITISYRGHGNADFVSPKTNLGFSCACKLCANKHGGGDFFLSPKLELLVMRQNLVELGNSKNMEFFILCEKILQAPDVREFAKQHPKEFLNVYCPVIFKPVTLHAASGVEPFRTVVFFEYISTLLKEVADALPSKKMYSWHLALSYMLLADFYYASLTLNRCSSSLTQSGTNIILFYQPEIYHNFSENSVQGNQFPDLKDSLLAIAKECAFAGVPSK